MSELKRTLSLAQCTLMGVGVMLGAGIYTLVGQAAASGGNAVWISFFLASLVAACTGLSYAELSSFIPKAGGEYYYARRALGGMVAFLVSWSLVVGIAMASAAVALGFAGYLEAIWNVNQIVGACLIVAATSGLLIYGISHSAWVAVFCTALELLGLAIVVAVGVPNLGSVNYLEMGPDGFSGVITAGALVFFAYIGFEEIVQLSEETRDATRNIPRALMLSIVVTTLLYVLVAICAVSVLPWEKLGESNAPLADVAAIALGQKAFWGLSIIALFSTGNTVLIMIMSASRLLYGMAEDGSMPASLAKVHETRKSPYVATIVVAIIAVILIVGVNDIGEVANVTNFSLLSAFVVINLAVIVLRYKEPDTPRPFKVPGAIGQFALVPVFGIGTSLFMLSYVGLKPAIIGIVIALAGLVAYFLIPRSKR